MEKKELFTGKTVIKMECFVLDLTELYLFLQISPVFMASLEIFSLLFFFSTGQTAGITKKIIDSVRNSLCPILK